MRGNTARRDRLRDAAIEVLAREGGRGLSHRAVDQAAQVPEGTAKNYFATRDALLQAAAERCVELYWIDLRKALGGARTPTNRQQLVAALRKVLQRSVGGQRDRLLAYLELHAEATRRPVLRQTLAELTRADFEAHRAAHCAAGLAVTPARLTMFMMCINGAIANLLTRPPELIEEIGLGNLEAFLSHLISAVYPKDG